MDAEAASEVQVYLFSGHHQDPLYFERLSGFVDHTVTDLQGILVEKAVKKELERLPKTITNKHIIHRIAESVRYERLNPSPERRARQDARLLRAEGMRIAQKSKKTAVKNVVKMEIK